MRGTTTKTIGAMIAILAASMTAGLAQSQIETLEVIAPGGPGSGQDQAMRAVADAMQAEGIVGNVEILNIAGGGGMIAIAQFLSTMEGNATAIVSQGAGHVLFPVANKTEVSLNDVAPLARLAGEYEVIVVPADSEVQTIHDLLEMYEADPGAVTWAGGGVGSTENIFFASLLQEAGLDGSKLNFISHTNSGEVVIAVLGRQVSAGGGGYQDFAAQVEAGELRVIVAASPERLEGVDAPTLKEEGIDLVLANWRGVSAHPSLSEEQLDGLSDAFEAMVASPRWKEILESRGWLDLYMPREEYAVFLDEEETRARETLGLLGMLPKN